VLLAVDGSEIASDGTVSFREDEGLDVYRCRTSRSGRPSRSDLRGGKRGGAGQADIPPAPTDSFPTYASTRTTYYIYGAFVFSPITVNC